VLTGVTVPLAFSLSTPQSRLKEGDAFHSNPHRAIELRQQLAALGFHFSVVLADSLYGESSALTSALRRLGGPDVVAIRSTHGGVDRQGWAGERQRQTRWRAFDRTFSDGTAERHSWAALPPRADLRSPPAGALLLRHHRSGPPAPSRRPGCSWPRCPTTPSRRWETSGDLFGSRTGSEEGFKQITDDLGWADYRVREAASLERWWEVVMSAYLLLSLQSPVFAALGSRQTSRQTSPPIALPLEAHPAWTAATGWKHLLNNLRLLLQPLVCASLLLPWLQLVPLPPLRAGLHDLCALMNTLHLAFLQWQ
jgi:hypothetical protein